jgi:hypothetical protein
VRARSRLVAPALALALAAVAAGAPGRAGARVTDPTAINRFDLRFEAGVGGPAGSGGGTLSIPWRFVALEGAIGWGWTGVNGSLGLRLIPARWGPNSLSVGAYGTRTHPLGFEPLGGGPSWFGTADVAYQRVVFIDKIVFIAAGVSYGRFVPVPSGDARRDRPYDAYFPAVRAGWGRRY